MKHKVLDTILENWRVIILHTYIIWKLPFAKLAKFPSCFQFACVAFLQIYWIGSQKFPQRTDQTLELETQLGSGVFVERAVRGDGNAVNGT